MAKNQKGLKPGAELPKTARNAKIFVEMAKMAKAKKALEDMKVYVYEVELVRTKVKSTDGSDRACTAAHVLICDGTKVDSDGNVHEEKKIVYID